MTQYAIVAKLNEAIGSVVQEPDIRSKFESQGSGIRIGLPVQLKKKVHEKI